MAPRSPLQTMREVFAGVFELERELGRGGTAYVFLAKDLQNDRTVALKVLRPELAASVSAARFIQEIEIEGRMKHENILPLYESGTVKGQLYYSMPFVVGETLKARLERERHLTVPDAIAVAADIARALDAAHALKVVHRDIKPANVLLQGSRAMVADFGIARAVSASAGEALTDSGVVVGTPEYMSPEQGAAQRDLDGRSDVYALGCVVFEMLAGEPPFTGRTAQAIIARHCHERPPSLRVVRPTINPALQVAVEKALAKVPTDRFATASEFVAALAAAPTTLGEDVVVKPRSSRGVWVALSVVAAAAAVAVAWWPQPALDTNRIMVFPLRDAPTTGGGPGGDEVATYIGYALDGTQPLKWLEGLEFLNTAERNDIGRLSAQRAVAIARRQRAAYFIDGAIVRGPDSVTVVLRLHSVAGDSLVGRTGASAPPATAFLPRLGLQAVASLLPALLEPGRRVDLSALSERVPTAIANFLQGEREYRRMHFATALDHYRAAVDEDSALALAALKGAEAANWLARFTEDTGLVAVAAHRERDLPRKQAFLAAGLQAYLTGNADSAVRALQRSIALDSNSAAAWTVLGEVYLRLLPSVTNADSLALAALEHARAADATFGPALLLLEEIALAQRDLPRAALLREAIRAAGADTSHRAEREVMLQCLRGGPAAVDWRRAVKEDARSVVAAGKLFSGRAAVPECARAAFESLVRADSSAEAESANGWVAMLGLQSLLIATGSSAEAGALLSRTATPGIPIWSLYLMDNLAGAGFEKEAATAVFANSANLATAGTPKLWLLGSWESAHGQVAHARTIARLVSARADSTRLRRDRLVARALEARLALRNGDTTAAITQLRALKADGPRNELAWQPWEALAGERLLLAELLMLRGDHQGAERAAGGIDAREPIIHLLYLRPSLDVRLRAATAMKDGRRAAEYRRRLAELSSTTVQSGRR